MIKINEACAILGLPEDDKGKSKAREVLNYFRVHTEEGPKPEGASFGKPSKLYDKEEVEIIARFRVTEFSRV
jgi:hypothetical protein